ncbi:MAG: glycosyltransferase family 9 protein [Prevotella sp.]|nr:glycosyltransferase family 9 protein [Prevotella sp.]
MNILVIRFRQMGDTILATPLLNTLHATFPEARIDLVLNERIAPLFEGHPALHSIQTFTDDERHHALTYLQKVWRIVHRVRYDVIIDMRSTVNTQVFALFSPHTPYRIGLHKSYTRLTSNHLLPECGSKSMVDHNISLAAPLAALRPLVVDRHITLPVSEDDLLSMRRYLEHMGIDISKPIVLMGVTAKLSFKVWHEDRMTEIIDRFIAQYPDVQIIFNYAPGQEEENARRIYRQLKDRSRVFIDVQAKSPRELLALSHHIALYFGNEGGARHIVHAAGRPSFVICAPGSLKSTWIPQDAVPADGVSAMDLADTNGLTPQQMYNLITIEAVWKRFNDFIATHHIDLKSTITNL